MSQEREYARKDVSIRGEPARASAEAYPGAVLVSTAFWLYWLDIALEQLEAAVTSRRGGEDARSRGEDVAHFLGPETRAGMVAAVAAAACIESFARRVVGLSPELPPVADGPAAKVAFETLRGRFNLDETDLDTRLRALFDDRNAAIHAAEEDKPTEPHPLGVRSGSGHAYFTMERASEAVELSVAILETCVRSVRDGAETRAVAEMMSRQAVNIRRRGDELRALLNRDGGATL